MKGIYLAVLGKVLWGLASLVLLAPVFYALLSSFKGKAEFFQSAWWQLPDEFRFGNYATAFAKIHFFGTGDEFADDRGRCRRRYSDPGVAGGVCASLV